MLQVVGIQGSSFQAVLNIRKGLIEKQIGAVVLRTIGCADELIGTSSFFSKPIPFLELTNAVAGTH